MSVVLELMKRTPLTIGADASVADAAAKMTEAGVGAILVTEQESLVGILSERDLVTKILAGGRDTTSTKISDIMNRKPVTVTPDTSVESCLEHFLEKGFRHLPVVGNSGELLGMLSSRDFLPLLKNKIGKIMDDASYQLFLEELDSLR